MEIIDYLIQFTDKNSRISTAKRVANALQAVNLIVFIKDPELNILLPGPGFIQSLPNGRHWKLFLEQNKEPVFKGEVPYEGDMCPALAVRGYEQSVAVLVGGTPGTAAIKVLEKLLAALAPLLLQETLTLAAESRALQNAKLTEKAERLTATLDTARKNLMNLLNENSNLLHVTRQQNNDLAAANEELAAANEEVIAGIEELNATNLRLLSINAELDNFIYTASHDLKSPISNIEGLITILSQRFKQRGWESEATNGIMEMINTSINRFKITLQDLTEIAKVGQDAKLQPLKVKLAELVDEVKSDLYVSIYEADARIETNLTEHDYVYFSRKNLKSILYNLLSNAVKYRDPARPLIISIKYSQTEEYVTLSVTDNGIGIAPKHHDRVFGLFKRFHTHVEGTGIGLYIVNKIIKDTGGKIELTSEEGTGTTFKVYFKKEPLQQ